VDDPGVRRAKKSLGQNFLVSPVTAGRIAAAVEPEAGGLLFEIGPGRGALTTHLVDAEARVVAYEIDGALVEALRERFGERRNLEIVQEDIRDVDLEAEAARRAASAYKVIGNIPYNLTGVILVNLAFLERCVRSVCMVQREVGERVLAPPGERRCGILSVFLQSYFDIERVLRVRPGAFRPRPRVESVVLCFTPRVSEGAPEERRTFLSLLKTAFSQRRKRLLGVLRAAAGSALGGDAFAGGALAGVDLRRRAEELALSDWFALFDGWTALKDGRR
jgi:16S rRNA (adenine1518-N6/adenine1519-N6)-dimethyltransferase